MIARPASRGPTRPMRGRFQARRTTGPPEGGRLWRTPLRRSAERYLTDVRLAASRSPSASSGSSSTLERTFADGKLKAYGKTDRSRRRVPLSRRASAALDALPRGADSRLIFPAPGGANGVKAGHGAHLDLHNWRARDWHPALEAAGLPPRRIYDLRHSFATWALAAGLSIRAGPLHGHVGRDDRPHLRAPRQGFRGRRAGQARRSLGGGKRNRLGHHWPTAAGASLSAETKKA